LKKENQQNDITRRLASRAGMHLNKHCNSVGGGQKPPKIQYRKKNKKKNRSADKNLNESLQFDDFSIFWWLALVL